VIDRKEFYKKVRKHFGKLKQSQVEGFEAILDLWDQEGYTDLRWLAYLFATVWHETARTVQPIAEYGKGKGRKYGKPDSKTGHVYYGRGFVQLTWAENYKKMGKILDLPLYEKPEMALELKLAVEIMFEGMLTRKSFKGDFTGKSLENYFNKKINDPVGARRIINGTDKAKLIAGYYGAFLDALTVQVKNAA
jgi:putative chitinase